MIIYKQSRTGFIKLVIFKQIYRTRFIILRRDKMNHTEALLTAEKYQNEAQKLAQKSYWKPKYHITCLLYTSPSPRE